MKKRTAIAIALLILFSTFTTQHKIEFTKFNLKKIQIENNSILNEKEIKELLIPLYEKNLIFLSYTEIEKALIQNSFIESFNIKKKYPQSLKIEIFEKQPIAILFNKKEKFYLSEKSELIKFTKNPKFKDLPYVIGERKKFKILYETLKKLDFPLKSVKKYILYESNRWDVEIKNKQIIKLPVINYNESVKNYLSLVNKNEFKKYKIFDFRINNQLILK
jgi:cell division septal protein FtsQ